MSEITDRIAAYSKTRPRGWETLRDWLANRRYPLPARYTREPDPTSDAFPYTEGTWDEVTEAYYTGLLTAEEHLEIIRAAEAHAAPPTAPG